MTVCKPARYGDRFYLKEHKLCAGCGESETRLDARFCCWCGVPFSIIVVEGLFKVETIVAIPSAAHPPALPVPVEE